MTKIMPKKWGILKEETEGETWFSLNFLKYKYAKRYCILSVILSLSVSLFIVYQYIGS